MGKDGILFDTIRALFSDKAYVQSLTAEAARQNIFMIIRRLGIMYPMQANVFNNSKVNALDEIRFWSDYLYNGGYAPRWVYTAGASKLAKKRDMSGIPKSLVKDYCIHNGIQERDFAAALRFFPDEAAAELEDFDTLNKQLMKNEQNGE